MNPADERPIHSSGAYNTVDANERTVRSMTDSAEQTVRRQNQPLISDSASLSLEDRPIRSSGAYQYQGQGIEDRPINASGKYNLEEQKGASQPTFDEDDDYSDYEDDFESDEDDEDSAVRGDIGSTPNLAKQPSVH